MKVIKRKSSRKKKSNNPFKMKQVLVTLILTYVGFFLGINYKQSYGGGLGIVPNIGRIELYEGALGIFLPLVYASIFAGVVWGLTLLIRRYKN